MNGDKQKPLTSRVIISKRDGSFCFPFENAIEVMDVATPLTYERYTGAFKWSWMTVMRKDDRIRSYPNTCSIDNLYFAGQRILPPGGLPTAVLTGRKVAQLLCKRYGMTFLGASVK